MHAEALAYRWAALLLGATLLTTGCVTLAPQPDGSGSQDPRTLSALRETATGTPPLQTPPSLASTRPGEQEQLSSTELGEQKRLHRRRSARGLGSDVAIASSGDATRREVASGGTAPQGPPTCGGQAVPPGWPDFSSDDGEALLAPFLTCTSPAEFLALQERVDMPRLVEALDDWRAVRLGGQGTPREDAAGILNRKRTSLLLNAAERHGAIPAEVLAVFIVDTAHDDDLREILFLLAQGKQLARTLALLPSFQAALENRGLKPTARADRDFQWSDLGRGLARAGRDALSSSPMSANAAAFNFSAIRGQLPPDYQETLDEAEKKWRQLHFSAGNMVLGNFDHLTFGVPLGFYGLLAGTGHGAYALSQGEYEQATRELAPAVLLVALYAGGKGARYLSEARGAAGVGTRVRSGLQAMEPRVRGLQELVRQLEAKLGVNGLRELARDIRASREAGRFVAVGGMDAALALREARGDVARAQAMMSRARPEATGSPAVRSGAETGPGKVATVADDATRPTLKGASAAERPEGLASLVDEQAGLTREVVEARLALVELEATGPRLPRDVAVLEKQRPSVDAPPPGAEGNPRWGEYVAYYEKRLGELKRGTAAEGPLRWAPYELMRGWFARGLAFERFMVNLLREDAKLPRAQRRFLGDFNKPRIETYVGVKKPGTGLRFADVLIIEEGELAGRSPRVEMLSFKSRNLSGLKYEALEAQMIADAREALQKYGETLDIRRDSLQPLLREGSEVPVQRVRLVYEGGTLKPKNVDDLKAAVDETERKVRGVEISFQ
ncbi:hypothetical protein [Archangium sp.]|uniref:hypothetical protein n=1 Tax=Archangium sp. TaxID=1872627 RepID=UPI002D284155|nr:hypothetical protein [Archangium sp.]HYO59832.1 hypothetical protein [Archangium sp.]